MNSIRHPALAVAFALTLSASAIAATDAVQKSSTPAATPSATGSVGKSELSAVDRTFITKASGAGLYEVEVSKLAADKADNQAVKEFALMMVKDHTAANEELKALARAHNAAVSTDIPTEKKPLIKKLSELSGAAFDKAYREQVGIKDHEEDIALFERQSKSGDSPELKAWAAKTLPKLKMHLEHGKALSSKG